jgi:hypothetical protein
VCQLILAFKNRIDESIQRKLAAVEPRVAMVGMNILVEMLAADMKNMNVSR